MNVCVLGGSGFVGTELVTRLALAGHWVRVPTRNLARTERLRVLDTVELRVANVHEPRILSQLFSGCDAVVNLVGILNPRRGASFDAVHTELAAKAMAAARTAGVRRVLHMSALGADAHAPSRYLRSKAAAEARLRAAPRPELSHADPAVTIFRPSVIFGPRDSLTNRFAGLLRLTLGCLPLARARALPCRIVPLPDTLARLQGLVMGLLPGKPFSLDNFRSLTLDSVCREDGCRRLGITPRPMLAVLPTYLEPRRPAAFA
ncbi:MAG: NAD-dependent epimerase/dehydratase family protein [Gammaproteobacteria bacterium]|nr:MAG: NAD-dependent epimerase/dehydratase family protein [Gammaproteobacteria bacterium]